MSEGSARRARKFHEDENKQKQALEWFRAGHIITKEFWEKTAFTDGSRLAPVIDKLRNSYGFDILGDGSSKPGPDKRKVGPHWIEDRRQLPTLIPTKEKHKKSYYTSAHWLTTRENRLDADGHRCVLCHGHEDLQVHHISYRLFSESLSELMTVCRECHERIHDNCKMAFPPGISAAHMHALGHPIEYQPWVLIGAKDPPNYFTRL